jgi:hypothetical protein
MIQQGTSVDCFSLRALEKEEWQMRTESLDPTDLPFVSTVPVHPVAAMGEEHLLVRSY